MPENRPSGLTCSHPRPERSVGGRPQRDASTGLLAGAVVDLTSVNGQSHTLTAALAEAYITNPQLLAQRALLRATDEAVPQALSFWRPHVSFTGQIGLNTESLQTPPIAPSFNSATGLATSSSDRRHIIT